MKNMDKLLLTEMKMKRIHDYEYELKVNCPKMNSNILNKIGLHLSFVSVVWDFLSIFEQPNQNQ